MNDKIEWVLAPREPTEAMWNAGKHFCDGHVTRAIQTYAAMLASAPKPEAQAAGVTDANLAEWEALRGAGMCSAVGEYTPPEFWLLLDEVKRLRALSTPASHDAQQATKDVHTEHCCARHGCKYGDDDCTVTTGRYPQSYPCEECETEDWSSAQQPAVVGDGVPLRVFSAGRWTYDGTGQTFSHEDMDAAAFVVYRDHAALTPAATPGDPEWEECPECSIGNGMRRGCDICDGSGSVPAAQKEGNGNG